jgi:pimeloyl-ACP methyl ester carboxylesterase
MALDGRTASASVAKRLVPVAALCIVVAACGSAYSKLRPETEIPECRAWLATAADAPATVHMVESGAPGGPSLRLAIEERGTGDSPRVDVLIHGILSDHRTWRYVATALAREHDVIVVDLPGCGGSDRPDPDDLPDGAYSPTAMARNVLVALRERLAARRGPTRVTLVAHSLGTAVVLRLLAAEEFRGEFADVLAFVDRAVLLSPMTFAVEKKDPLFEKIALLTGAEETVAELTGILRDSVSDSILTGVDDPATAPREEADRVFDILSHRDTRRAAQAMIRSAIPFKPDGRCDWDAIERLEGDYANVRVPCLLVCGGRDETLPQAMSFRLRQLLPNAWLRVIPHAMHTLPTEKPAECVDFVRRFDASGGRGWVAFDDGRAAPAAEVVAASASE